MGEGNIGSDIENGDDVDLGRGVCCCGSVILAREVMGACVVVLHIYRAKSGTYLPANTSTLA